eukprot:6174677-Pleurochrysis_carterae.AAC.7
MYSAPAAWAIFNRMAVRRTTSFACSNSRRWWGGTSGSPMMLSQYLKGDGPSSAASALWNNRDTEKVEHGREATIVE